MPRELPFLPEKALDRMYSDLQAHGDITRKALAERIIEDAAPLAAYTIVDLAVNAEDENTRLRAASDLLDRANGKAKTSLQLNVTEENPVMRILDGVVVERPTANHTGPEAPADNPNYPQTPVDGGMVIDQDPATDPQDS